MTEVEVPPAASSPRLVPSCVEDLVDERTRELIHQRRSGRGHRRRWVVRRALVSADVLGLTFAFVFSQLITNSPHAISTTNKIGAWAEVLVFVVTLPLWVVLSQFFGLYSKDEEHADHTTVDDASGVFVVVTIGAFMLLVGSWATGVANPYMPKLMVFWVSSILLISISRTVARAYVRQSTAYLQNTVIVGAGAVGQLIASKVLRHPEYGINLLGFVDKTPRSRRDDIGDLSIIGGIGDLRQIIDELDVERVVIAFAGQDQGELLSDLRPLRLRGVQVDVVPRFFDLIGPGAQFHAVEGLPMVGLSPLRLPASSRFLKRALDICGSLIGLAVLWPFGLLIGIGIKLDSPGPVLFRQRRPGLHGELFTVLKFRTMEVAPDSHGGNTLRIEEPYMDEFSSSFKIRNDPRITRLGSFLRRSSLDELPQLVNVLRGETSLVGPRPMLIEEMAARGDKATQLLSLKPGITGYWQINGRSDLDYEDRIRLELAYVGGWSIGLDLTILCKTLRSVVSGVGAR